MRKTMTGLLAITLMLLPTASFASSMDDWQAFLKQQREKQAAFSQQLKQERDAFLAQHPDIVAALAEQAAAARARAQERVAARER